MKVKICGITNPEDALLCENCGADMLGFIFYDKSKRFINPDDAAIIIRHLSMFTIKVGVFVNETADKINSIVDKTRLNAVQLHGDEIPELVEQISVPVIKSFRINEQFDFNVIKQYNTSVPLLDTYSNTQYGGTGKHFRWDLIPEELYSKIILAGGISIENIEEVYKSINPLAVDLSSSLEKGSGKKDKIKVTEFFNKIKQIRRQ